MSNINRVLTQALTLLTLCTITQFWAAKVLADAPARPPLPPTLYVVIGGNGSCMAPGVSSVFPDLQDNELFRGFTSNIAAAGLLTANDNVLFTCYEWLSPMMRLYDARYQPVMVPLHEAQLDEVVLSRSANMSRVVIIGHSYGGWRAMKLAASPLLAAYMRAPITLVSIDAVSKVNCPRLREPGCRGAPSDFSPEESGYLNTKTRWLNAYQTRGVLLNSGMLTAAHANVEVVSNHIAIQTDRTVWNATCEWIHPKLCQAAR
jgi:hypothetical protein